MQAMGIAVGLSSLSSRELALQPRGFADDYAAFAEAKQIRVSEPGARAATLAEAAAGGSAARPGRVDGKEPQPAAVGLPSDDSSCEWLEPLLTFLGDVFGGSTRKSAECNASLEACSKGLNDPRMRRFLCDLFEQPRNKAHKTELSTEAFELCAKFLGGALGSAVTLNDFELARVLLGAGFEIFTLAAPAENKGSVATPSSGVTQTFVGQRLSKLGVCRNRRLWEACLQHEVAGARGQHALQETELAIHEADRKRAQEQLGGLKPCIGMTFQTYISTSDADAHAVVSGPQTVVFDHTSEAKSAGLMVLEVVPDMAAARAGIRTGDVITYIGERDGQLRRVKRKKDYFPAMENARPGDRVAVQLFRPSEIPARKHAVVLTVGAKDMDAKDVELLRKQADRLQPVATSEARQTDLLVARLGALINTMVTYGNDEEATQIFVKETCRQLQLPEEALHMLLRLTSNLVLHQI
jgi:hypothetical protein